MIRNTLRALYVAAKIELEHWRNQRQEPLEELVPAINEAVVVAPPTARVEADSRWVSGAFQSQVLKSSTCPDCEGVKKVGCYRCPKCTDVVLAERAKREADAPWNKVEVVSPPMKRAATKKRESAS